MSCSFCNGSRQTLCGVEKASTWIVPKSSDESSKQVPTKSKDRHWSANDIACMMEEIKIHAPLALKMHCVVPVLAALIIVQI